MQVSCDGLSTQEASLSVSELTAEEQQVAFKGLGAQPLHT